MGGPLLLYSATLEDGVLLTMPVSDAVDHNDELELDPAIKHSVYNIEHSTY